MAYRKKSWQEKLLHSKGLPKIERPSAKIAKRWGIQPDAKVLIPAPIEVDEIMKQVPYGKLITINQIRKALASKHKADVCCPLTTGIFAVIVAYASEERKAQGKGDLTPYWRILKGGGVLNEKYPGGIENQMHLLKKEGHTIIACGKKYIVKDFEKYLFEF
ncbi:MAG: MGMT family protein [candidate division WOR-3 bacterium]|nr:MGMT family protein [candidate division WOR-3 bacterium]MDW7988316.1 MGMT family protein [candidate division WOR-3 bacterium]